MHFPGFKIIAILSQLQVSIVVQGDFIQQGSKLVGTGSVSKPYQGESVGLSSDGNTLAIGGGGGLGDTGAVWIFTRSGSTWSQQGGKLVGIGDSGGASQGRSLALSSDGNTLASGGPIDNNYAGAVWIFTRTGSTWSQQGAKLVGTGAVGYAEQGYSVALSSDGSTLASGGSGDSSGNGAVWIFTRSGSTWSQQNGMLVGTGATGASQGYAVALNSDGDTLASGSDGLGVWIFTRNGTSWSQQGTLLSGTGGQSVALNSDGNTLAIGNPFDGAHSNIDPGAVWIFTRTGSTWSQQGDKLIAGLGDARLGWRVALSADGNIMASSGYADNTSMGAAWTFTRTGTTWSQYGSKLVGNGAIGYAAQGFSLALSSDGHTLATGGDNDDPDNGLGATWVFYDPPTISPSRTPSRQPSEAPSRSPVPSKTPSKSPHKPSKSPSKTPSTSPHKPTKSPSISPRKPTKSPSTSPHEPTKSPSISPRKPTKSPSTSPHRQSHTPSQHPIIHLSISPSRSPTRPQENALNTSSLVPTTPPMTASASTDTALGTTIGGVLGAISFASCILFLLVRRYHRTGQTQQPSEIKGENSLKLYKEQKGQQLSNIGEDSEKPSVLVRDHSSIDHARVHQFVQRALGPSRNSKPIRKIISEILQRSHKLYGVFISYHQAGAAAEANVFYDLFLSLGFTESTIFLDKNRLHDIRTLAEAIKSSVIVVQLQSSLLYTRPFTLIEAYEAIQSKIPIVPVALDSYNFENAAMLLNSPNFVETLNRNAPGAGDVIRKYGIDPGDLGRTIAEEFPNLVSLPYRSSDTKRLRDAMLLSIAERVMELFAAAGTG